MQRWSFIKTGVHGGIADGGLTLLIIISRLSRGSGGGGGSGCDRPQNNHIQDLMLGGCEKDKKKQNHEKNQLLFEKNVAEMTKMNRLFNLPLKLSKPNLWIPTVFGSIQLENNYIIISSLLFIWQLKNKLTKCVGSHLWAWETVEDILWQNKHFTIVIPFIVSVCSRSDGSSLTAQPCDASVITTDANSPLEQMRHLLETHPPLPACCRRLIPKNWFHSRQMCLCVGLPGSSAVVLGFPCVGEVGVSISSQRRT